MPMPRPHARVKALAAALLAGIALSTITVRPSQADPLALDGHKDLFQRVISLPGAELRDGPAENAKRIGKELPVFGVYYVFKREKRSGRDWVRIGENADGNGDGWVAADKVSDWTKMLVMQYAPPGQRQPVLFFEDRDRLAKLVMSPNIRKEAPDLIARAAQKKADGIGVLSMENVDSGAVTFSSNPYLMPILDAKSEMFDDGTETVLLEVASLNAEQLAKPKKPPEPPIAQTRRAIVFVIDTTSSMGPYIEQAFRTVQTIYDGMAKRGLLKNTSFGLVGYRNNMDSEPQRSRLEYVSRVFQPLDPSAPPEAILKAMGGMKAATVSTHTWNEDGIAGLYDAIEGMDWTPFNEAKLIVQISDAGMLGAKDPKAKHPKLGVRNIREMAERRNIAVIPIHLLTPEAQKIKNVGPAAEQYRELGATGDISTQKYKGVPGGDVAKVAADFDGLVNAIEKVAQEAARGVAQARPELKETDSGISLGSLFLNEVYRAQQVYLGSVQGAEAPAFYKAWASDRDLAAPERLAMTVSVFLTRNQLSELAQSLDRLIREAEGAMLSPKGFFDQLSALSAATATDPKRYGASFDKIAASGLLPSYLDLLPYRSEVLSLSKELWEDMGYIGQARFIDNLRLKLETYRSINEDQAVWKSLGNDKPGQQVYPMPLGHLP